MPQHPGNLFYQTWHHLIHLEYAVVEGSYATPDLVPLEGWGSSCCHATRLEPSSSECTPRFSGLAFSSWCCAEASDATQGCRTVTHCMVN